MLEIVEVLIVLSLIASYVMLMFMIDRRRRPPRFLSWWVKMGPYSSRKVSFNQLLEHLEGK